MSHSFQARVLQVQDVVNPDANGAAVRSSSVTFIAVPESSGSGAFTNPPQAFSMSVTGADSPFVDQFETGVVYTISVTAVP